MKIEFSTDNAAFRCGDDDMDNIYLQDECVHILHKIAHDISCDKTSGVILDVNGNKIGEWSL